MNISEFLEVVKWRHSCRAYDATKTVSDEAINNCLVAVNNAPSACNRQPARWIIVKDEKVRRELHKRGILPGLPMPWIDDAPVIAVLCAKSNLLVHWFAPILSKVPYYLVDSGIAGEHFALAAAAQGLGTCWLGWINPKGIKQVLGIPAGIQPIAMFTLGYPKEKKEAVAKLPLEEIVHYDRW